MRLAIQTLEAEAEERAARPEPTPEEEIEALRFVARVALDDTSPQRLGVFRACLAMLRNQTLELLIGRKVPRPSQMESISQARSGSSESRSSTLDEAEVEQTSFFGLTDPGPEVPGSGMTTPWTDWEQALIASLFL